MRDNKKFCKPIISKYPKIGDVLVRFNDGSIEAVNPKEFKKVQNYFKFYSILGADTQYKPGYVKVFNKELNKEVYFSPVDYSKMNSNLVDYEIAGGKYITGNYEYVDLDLPSGTLWAKVNIGAESETQDGTYYRYGELIPYTPMSEDQSSYSGTSKELPLTNDVANKIWGKNWHIPTKAQAEELINNTNHTWETDFNGVSGMKLTSKNDSSKYIFIPASGAYTNGELNNKGNAGYILTSTQINNSVYYLLASQSYLHADWSTAYGRGNQIRPVCETIEDSPNIGDIIAHNNLLNIDRAFEYSDWIELDDSWDTVGLYGIETLEEQDCVGGEYVILSNSTTFIINASDYSKVSSYWEHVDTIE